MDTPKITKDDIAPLYPPLPHIMANNPSVLELTSMTTSVQDLDTVSNLNLVKTSTGMFNTGINIKKVTMKRNNLEIVFAWLFSIDSSLSPLLFPSHDWWRFTATKKVPYYVLI